MRLVALAAVGLVAVGTACSLRDHDRQPGGWPLAAGEGDGGAGDATSGDPGYQGPGDAPALADPLSPDDDNPSGDTGPDADGGPGDPGAAADADNPGDSDGPPASCTIGTVSGTCVAASSCDAGEPMSQLCDGAYQTQCCIPGGIECSVDGVPGACLDISECSDGYSPSPGHCPGPAYIQCCTEDARQNTCESTDKPLDNDGLGPEEPGVGGCPPGMIGVADFCIDRYEASLVRVDAEGDVLGSFSPYANPGSESVRARSVPWAVPQGYINADQAEAACGRAGKRLCTSDEWLRACRGASLSRVYPYGNTKVPGACNDERNSHPVIEYFDSSASWIWSQLGHPCINQLPASVDLTGENSGCTTPEGVLDLVGNLHEWVADSAGTFRGGFYVDTVLNGVGCAYATTAHTRPHWDYSTGFRCCAD